MTCHVWQLSSDDAPWNFAANWDFSADMVNGVKTHIPSRARRWQPERRRWVFRQDQLDTVLALADVHCHGWVYGDRDDHVGAGTPQRLTAGQAYARLCVTPAAPPELIGLAYKFWAKRLHPDRGGDDATMQEINAAYAVLERLETS